MTCPFSFFLTEDNIEPFFLLHGNTAERNSGSQNKSSEEKKPILLISTIFCRCLNNWEANLQKQRDYISLKMPSFKNVWVTDLTAETHGYANWESGLKERSTFHINGFLRFLLLVLYFSDFYHFEKSTVALDRVQPYFPLTFTDFGSQAL